jgi:hypothetical protein
VRIHGRWGEDSFHQAQGDAFRDIPCHHRARGEDEQIAMFLIVACQGYGRQDGRLNVDYLRIERGIVGIEVETIGFDETGCRGDVVFFGGAVCRYFLYMDISAISDL